MGRENKNVPNKGLEPLRNRFEDGDFSIYTNRAFG